MSKKVKLSWGERFALIDHYKPSDAQICAAFELPQDDLDTARTLRAAGTLAADGSIDVAKYSDVFATSVATPSTQDVVGAGTVTVHTKPETATKKVKVAQKRGRKGDKITKALQSVPTKQIPVEQFMKQYDVSLAVLRQSKRFIEKLDVATQITIGRINVKQDKKTKQLMIWKENL